MNMVYSALIAYLVGAIPFSLFIGLAWGKDIRKIGSGNIGATNVWRSCGNVAGAMAYFTDIAKGSLAVYLATLFFPETIPNGYGIHLLYIFILFLPIIGHVFPIYLKFKGGKGVATSAGVLLILTPVPVLIVIGIFLVVFLLKKIISLASLVAAIAYPFSFYFFYPKKEITLGEGGAIEWVMHGSFHQLLPITILLALAIVVKHRSNISRLIKGEEFTFKKGKNG